MPEKSSTSAVGAYLIAQEPAGKKVESFLRALFHLLDEYDVRYCVLHSWESLPEGLSSDLDLAAHRQDASKVSSVFQQLQAGGYTPVQCLNYFAHCYQFAFHWFEGDASKVAIVDLMFEHRRAGMIFATGDEIVANRHRHREFWIPSSRAEFGYLLAKKTWKRGASAGQVIRLRQLAAEIGLAEAEGIASQFLGTKSKKRIAQACAKGTVHEILANGRRELWKNALLRHPLTAIRFVVAECQRAVYRWLRPTGVLVAVLGPDGAGKSAVIDRLLADVGPLFRHQRLFHWRPGFLGHGKDAGPNLDPQGQIPRGALFSVFYILFFFVDYWLGYLLVIRPRLVRSTLVVFDRYFHDIQVDPRRYRYGGPQWLAKFLSWLVPEPDVVLQLVADERLIVARKRELPALEIERQLRAYRELRFGQRQACVVRTDIPIGRTRRSAAGAVLQFMKTRLDKAMQSWMVAEA